ncbi:hypothetical protein REG_1469 [Candidatus Regiella insecticola LSR1]|uniref:Uncharacterized protein n=1 Tax=Candidatus Regiella insecticola LSR1 TaxID=663321 RepID=E0WTU3_9ENTR|nr:hypothetical protein REG_1469 [Candidatus Regiella insecticola LSR1]
MQRIENTERKIKNCHHKSSLQTIICSCIPFAFEVAARRQGVRPMSVDRLRDSAKYPQPIRGGASKAKGINIFGSIGW